MTAMDFEAIVAQLGQRIGLKSLAPDEGGHVQLTFHGPIVVDIERPPTGQGYVLVGRLGPELTVSDPAVLRRLLEGNLLDRLARRSFFGLDPSSGQVVLCCRRDDDVDYQTFEAELERFLDRLDELRRSHVDVAAPQQDGFSAFADGAIRA